MITLPDYLELTLQNNSGDGHYMRLPSSLLAAYHKDIPESYVHQVQKQHKHASI